MEKKLTTLEPFFLHPRQAYHIRELAKLIHRNHTSVRTSLRRLVKEGYLIVKKETPYDKYQANISSPQYTALKLYYNLERLRESGLLGHLEKVYEYPVIILFGSYAQGLDDEESDIDLGILAEAKPLVSLEKYERALHRKVSLHAFTKKEWNIAKQKNPPLVNSICNGIVLAGQLEVVP